MPADVWEELEHAMTELMVVFNAASLPLEEWAEAYRSEYRERYGREAGEGQVRLAVTAERLTRRWPPTPATGRPALTLIEGGRDDA